MTVSAEQERKLSRGSSGASDWLSDRPSVSQAYGGSIDSACLTFITGVHVVDLSITNTGQFHHRSLLTKVVCIQPQPYALSHDAANLDFFCFGRTYAWRAPSSLALVYCGEAASVAGLPEPVLSIDGVWSTPIAAARKEAAAALLASIRAFQVLPTDWDGDDTVLVNDETVATAARLIDALEAEEFALPQASPSSDGDVGLNWYRDRDVLEVTLAPDMHAFWASRVSDQVVPGRVVAVDTPEFPSLIIETIREFYSGAAGVPLRR